MLLVASCALLLMFPSRSAPVYHLGLFREKVTLQPVECKCEYSVHALKLTRLADYSKLPASPPVDMVYLLDPLIATGGTALAALTMIIDWGIPGTFTRSLISSH